VGDPGSVLKGQWGPGLCSRGSVGDPGSVHEGQWGPGLYSRGSVGTRALFMRVSGDPGSVHEGQWGTRALFLSPTANGKTLFVWREVLVLMERILLPEGRDSHSVCPG